jgi:hypothetical protein
MRSNGGKNHSPRSARRSRRISSSVLLNFVLFVLLCLRFFAACANFLSQVRRCPSVIPAKAGIQVGWWCGRRVRHNFLPARRRKGWIPASAGMTENEPAFHVWLRLCRARRFVVKDCSPLVRLRRAAFFAVNRLFTFFPALRDSEHGWAFRRRKREYRPPPQRNTARSFRASRIRGAAYR